MDKTIKFMNTKEVAQALSCSLPTARRIMQREDFPLIRVGKNMKVNAEVFILNYSCTSGTASANGCA